MLRRIVSFAAYFALALSQPSCLRANTGMCDHAPAVTPCCSGLFCDRDGFCRKRTESKASEEMPIAELKPEYISKMKPQSVSIGNSSGSNFVFLQRFPLWPLNLFFHTEVVVCPRDGFSKEDQSTLDSKIAGMTDFAELDESWWSTKTANCVELGYGGAMCKDECCSVPHGDSQTSYPLNARRAVIGNADTSQKRVYIYGTGAFDGNIAFHDTCDKKCWSNWAGTDYNPLTNNCNTFTSTVLKMVYGLSEKKPNLGPSDMVTVHGHCPSQDQSIVTDSSPVSCGTCAAGYSFEKTRPSQCPDLTDMETACSCAKKFGYPGIVGDPLQRNGKWVVGSGAWVPDQRQQSACMASSAKEIVV